MSINEIKHKLSSVNWDFDFRINYSSQMNKPINCRKYFSYPATFIPEIPYTLIEILSQKGNVVIDPFGGIGTTFMQALLLERQPYTFDINLVSSNVCDTLYSLLDPRKDLEQLRAVLMNICDEFDLQIDYSLEAKLNVELDGWYAGDTYNELLYLKYRAGNTTDIFIQRVIQFVLSSVLVSSSSQNKGWAYIADNVKPKNDEIRGKSAIELFRSASNVLINDMKNHLLYLSETYELFYETMSKHKRVFSKSILECEMSNESVDLIITSPPYPRMIDYVKSQRLSYAFIGEDFNQYTKLEIGARCRRARADALTDYERSINEIVNKLSSLLKKGGFMCFILPQYDSEDKRESTINNVVSHIKENGFEIIFEVERYIPSNKRTLSIQWAKLTREKIYVFKKTGE